MLSARARTWMQYTEAIKPMIIRVSEVHDQPPSQQTTTRRVVVCIPGISQRATAMDTHESTI